MKKIKQCVVLTLLFALLQQNASMSAHVRISRHLSWSQCQLLMVIDN